MRIPFDNSYAKLPEAFFQRGHPTPVAAPVLIRLNRGLATSLGMDPDFLESPDGLAILSGNQVPEGADPLAMAYSGHQFGGFSPQLGDGRAILLGEVIGKDGLRRDIQLKGPGLTPFSRRGDGRSALGPVLREYIVSEAMATLGVSTTRALAAVASGENVVRDGVVPGGIFTRVAASHIRIGTFQWFAARQDSENLRILADYVIARHYPNLLDAENRYLALLDAVIARQARLIAHWMQLGFIHGVMNTDNMSVSGETIDYGPCAFLDTYHPLKKFSFIDQQGRYAFARQGEIAHWNLTRFAETLIPLIHQDTEKSIAHAEAALERFPEIHHDALQQRLTAKIGLEGDASHDWPLVTALLEAMTAGEADFTLVFRHLTIALETDDNAPVIRLFNQPDAITSWLSDWRTRIQDLTKDDVLALMRRSNPIFIPRNHRIEEAIQAAYRGDYQPFHRLNDILQHPFAEQPDTTEYESAPAPEQIVQATFCGT